MRVSLLCVACRAGWENVVERGPGGGFPAMESEKSKCVDVV